MQTIHQLETGYYNNNQWFCGVTTCTNQNCHGPNKKKHNCTNCNQNGHHATNCPTINSKMGFGRWFLTEQTNSMYPFVWFCGVVKCTSCKPNQHHFCKNCKKFSQHRSTDCPTVSNMQQLNTQFATMTFNQPKPIQPIQTIPTIQPIPTIQKITTNQKITANQKIATNDRCRCCYESTHSTSKCPSVDNQIKNACICFVDSRNNVFITTEASGHAANKKGLPGGKLDSNELPFDGAERELREETNIRISKTNFTDRSSFVDITHLNNTKTRIFVLFISDKFNDNIITLDPNEISGFQWVHKDNVKNLDLRPGFPFGWRQIHSQL